MKLALWIALAAWLIVAAASLAFVALGMAVNSLPIDWPRMALRSLGWPWAFAQWAWHRALRFSTIQNGWFS